VESLPVEEKKHIFCYASTVMRSVIVDFARAHARVAGRRAGDADHVVLDSSLSEIPGTPEGDVRRVPEAPEVLAQADAALAKTVEMRYFGGLTKPEIAEASGISDAYCQKQLGEGKVVSDFGTRISRLPLAALKANLRIIWREVCRLTRVPLRAAKGA
jgi:DNA-directed RNA polymerase specialized sigma24 family protein